MGIGNVILLLGNVHKLKSMRTKQNVIHFAARSKKKNWPKRNTRKRRDFRLP